jgi:hypothetical protein
MMRGCSLELLRRKVKEAAEGRSPVGRASPTFSTIFQSAEPLLNANFAMQNEESVSVRDSHLLRFSILQFAI